MTAKEQLHQLVDVLDDDQAVRALALLEPLAELELVVAGARRSSSTHDTTFPTHESYVSHDTLVTHDGELLQVTRCSGRHRRW